MLTIFARNVAEALPAGLHLLRDVGQEEESRAGKVLVAPSPVMTVYDCPTERVIYSAQRDANPFFHLAEAMWMLTGRNDAAFLNLFVRNFGERFAQPNGTVHGAYGFRWREHFAKDQLQEIIRLLRAEPTSRQAVLTMWDPNVDLWAVGVKDKPCNTQIYFRIHGKRLQMTVTCRSNDIHWGAYGANAVHFSFLQEYLAAFIGVGIGPYYHLSNNYHAYVDELAKRPGNMHDIRNLPAMPLVTNSESFDNELIELLWNSRMPTINKFLQNTVWPMLNAHHAWRIRHDPAPWLARIEADDWRTAAFEWCHRRERHARIA